MENVNWIEQKGAQGIWLPEKKGEELVGEVIEVTTGQYGKQLVIVDKDGNKITTPSHKALQARLAGILIGNNVRIVYDGQDLPKVKGQKGTNLYRVFINITIIDDVK